MNEYLMVEINPQVSVMFKDKQPVRAFIDIDAATEQLDKLLRTAVETINLPPEPKKI